MFNVGTVNAVEEIPRLSSMVGWHRGHQMIGDKEWNTTVDTPVGLMNRKPSLNPLAGFKATLVETVIHSLVALDANSLGAKKGSALEKAFEGLRGEIRKFVSQILDPLIVNTAAVQAVDEAFKEHVVAAKRQILRFEQGIPDALQAESRSAARIEVDRLYFSLNNASGMMLRLLSKLRHLETHMPQALSDVRYVMGDIYDARDLSVDWTKIRSFEALNGQLQEQLRCLYWGEAICHSKADMPMEVVALEIGEGLPWQQLPLAVVALSEANDDKALDHPHLRKGKGELIRLFESMTSLEAFVARTLAIANQLEGAACAAMIFLTQQRQLQQQLEVMVRQFDRAMTKCVMVQCALREGDYQSAQLGLDHMAALWDEAQAAVSTIAVDLVFYRDEPAQVGMDRKALNSHLRKRLPTGSIC